MRAGVAAPIRFGDFDALDALDLGQGRFDALRWLVAEALDDHARDPIAHLEAHDHEPEVALDHGRRIAGEIGVVGLCARRGREQQRAGADGERRREQVRGVQVRSPRGHRQLTHSIRERATLRAMRTAIGDAPRAVLWLALGATAGIGCAALGLLLSGERDRALPANAAASVNGAVIRLEEYDRAVAAFASDRRDPIGPEERRHVLDRMLDEELLVQRGLELGLARSDRRVRGDIVSAVIELVVSQADGVEPSEGEVRAFYEENRDYFAHTERLLVQQVFVRAAPLRSEDEARARAEQATRRLRAGEPLDRVRETLGDSEVAPVPRDLLPIAKLREYLGPTAARAAEALEVGGASDPQRSASGYHVLVLLDRSPGRAPPLSDVQEEVRAELRRRVSERALRTYLDDLRARADVRVRRRRSEP